MLKLANDYVNAQTADEVPAVWPKFNLFEVNALLDTAKTLMDGPSWFCAGPIVAKLEAAAVYLQAAQPEVHTFMRLEHIGPESTDAEVTRFVQTARENLDRQRVLAGRPLSPDDDTSDPFEAA